MCAVAVSILGATADTTDLVLLPVNMRLQAFNHNKTVAEAMQALSWLAYTGPNCGTCAATPITIQL